MDVYDIYTLSSIYS